LLDQTSVTHLFPITKYIGLIATGLTGMVIMLWCTYHLVSSALMPGILFLMLSAMNSCLDFVTRHWNLTVNIAAPK
jgi:hypothetical protein